MSIWVCLNPSAEIELEFEEKKYLFLPNVNILPKVVETETILFVLIGFMLKTMECFVLRRFFV